jgi:catechol 2,3-dioxygenase-like lactoylglutathione lyase family enzyme
MTSPGERPDASFPQPGVPLRAERLLETAIYGPDLEALERFYVTVLGLEPVARTPGRNVVLRCGPAALILFDPAASSAPGGPFPPHGTPDAAPCGHIAFTVPLDELPAWRSRLADASIPIETEVEWPDGHRSIYFRDPAGNSVELAPPTLWNGLGYAGAAPTRR